MPVFVRGRFGACRACRFTRVRLAAYPLRRYAVNTI
jgi:hypothetical protein